jgi:hypothetical protein
MIITIIKNNETPKIKDPLDISVEISGFSFIDVILLSSHKAKDEKRSPKIKVNIVNISTL